MKILKDKVGLSAAIAVALGIIITLFNWKFGTVIFTIGFLIAFVTLYKGFKKEQLNVKDYLAVAAKENTLSIISIVAVLIFVWILPYIASVQAFDFNVY